MPHDPQRVADTKAWLAKADDDLRGAQVDLAAQPPLLGDAVFHCQQASEGLTSFAWVFRYPGEPEEPTIEEAQGALAVAHDVRKAVLARLPEEVRA